MIAIHTEVVGEQQVLAAFTDLAEEFDDLAPVFDAMGEEALEDMQRRIDSHPGPPLAPSTIKRKGHSRILRDSGDLYASFQKAAAGNVARIAPGEAEFGSGIVYGVYHQTGTARMPKRTIIEVTGEQEAKYARIAGNVLTERIRQIGFEVS